MLGAAQALDVDLVFIGVQALQRPDVVETLAVCDRGQVQPNFSYALNGTPCEYVLGQSFQYHRHGIQQRFPDPHLKEVGGIGYAAIPLFDSEGRSMGLMAAIDRRPLGEAALFEQVLRVFSVRAAVELERRQADQARRYSEESYRSLFDAAEDALFIYDADTGAILDVNPKACAVYGYSTEEFRQVDIRMLGSGGAPFSREFGADMIERAKRNRQPIYVEWQRRTKDGSLHWDEVYIKLVRLGGVDRVLAVTREITERKEREEALRKSEDRLRATVDTALDCIVAIDEQDRIIEFNPAAEETFGHQRERVLGLSLSELIVPERHRLAHAQGMERYLSTGEANYLGRRVELTALRADGSEFPVEVAIDAAQGPEGRIFIGYLRDITDYKRAEAERLRLEGQLLQAQKMEAIGQLTGGIAHDFNNILTGTMGYLSMARERAGRYEDGKLDNYLERAEQAGYRARDLIQQMLTFSRGQRGEPRSLQLVTVVEECLKLLHSTLPSSIEIDTEFEPSLPCVLLDPLHLEQVLVNLCINARDAMAGKGEITLALRAVRCDDSICTSCHQPVAGHFVELAVTDTGSGIAPGVIERMFEPFYSTKDVGKGSGMGLAMVHGIVHDHGGHIQVDTDIGSGSTIRIRFPAWFPPGHDSQAHPAARATTDRSFRSGPALTGRVLLAEDEASVREFMGELLSSWGLEVTLAENGVEVCERFAAEPDAFDLVLLDQTMPRMTGIGAAEQIGKLRPAVPLILYTGYSEQVSKARLAAAGIRMLFRKPLDIEDFRASLETLFSGQDGDGT